MAFHFRIFDFVNLLRQPAAKNATTPDKYLPYGPYDRWPLDWSKTIQNSPTGRSCLSTVQDFIEGDGFSDPDLEKLVVNPSGETFWQIHQKTSDSWGEFEGFAWLLRYNALGKITEIVFLPFENCRLGKPDSKGYISKIYYNPFFGTKDYNGQDKKQTKIYDTFNPEAVKEQMLRDKSEYLGQVLYVATTTTLDRFYPKHEAVSSKEWMRIEASVADYHDENLSNGMLQPFMLLMKGDPNAPTQNPDYADFNGDGKPATVAQEFDEIVAENFMGAKRIGNMWVQWVNSTEEAPTVLTLPANNNGDLFNNLDNQSTKKITLGWKVPSVLANINEGASLGGDGNLIRVAVKLMQQRSIRKQRYLTEAYQKVLKNLTKPYLQDVKITPYNPYPELEMVDDKIWETMTLDEKRKWIEDHTDIELLDNAVVQPDQPTPGITNAIPIEFSDSIKNTVKKSLEYSDKMGLKCGGTAGKGVAQMIVDGSPMGFKQLKRIYSYLKKNEQYADRPFQDGCPVILYNQWGGKAMYEYLDSKIKDIDKWLN